MIKTRIFYFGWVFTGIDFPGGSDGKASVYIVGDPGLIRGWGRSPAEGNGNPPQYPCFENPMDGGAWWATGHGVAKSQTRLSDFTVLELSGNSADTTRKRLGQLY